MNELSKYTKALAAGQVSICVQIEQRHDLYGYPPEIVAAGLKAFDQGRNPADAVEDYLNHGVA